MMDKRQLRTWADIDLDALAHNYRAIQAAVPEGCRVLGPVKANAYGHGMIPVAQKLQQLGASMLAVACVSEGEELRKMGIHIPILCLGHTPIELGEELLHWDITQTVDDYPTAKALSDLAQRGGKKLKVHIKLDTGMGRLGFRWEDENNGAVLQDMVRVCHLPGLMVGGMFTHFAAADGDEAYTMAQFTRFLSAKAALEQEKITLKIYHCGASAAVLHYPCTCLDMVRPGLALYGHYPDQNCSNSAVINLKPVMTLKSRIATVRTMPNGASVSYGCTAHLKRDTRLAVLPIGYGDGLPRNLSNQLEVLIQGKLCPVVGNICMDMCMVDVTDLPEVKAGEVATIYGPELTDRAAQLANTISYELLCRIAPRVPRIYWENGVKVQKDFLLTAESSM